MLLFLQFYHISPGRKAQQGLQTPTHLLHSSSLLSSVLSPKPFYSGTRRPLRNKTAFSAKICVRACVRVVVFLPLALSSPKKILSEKKWSCRSSSRHYLRGSFLETAAQEFTSSAVYVLPDVLRLCQFKNVSNNINLTFRDIPLKKRNLYSGMWSKRREKTLWFLWGKFCFRHLLLWRRPS